MESLDMGPNKEEKLEKLNQDFDKPFSPPPEVKESISVDHPCLDTGIDAHEWYDEGASAAAEATPPRKRSVLNYRPILILERSLIARPGVSKK